MRNQCHAQRKFPHYAVNSRPARGIEFYTKVCNMTNRYKNCNWDISKQFNGEADPPFSAGEGAYSKIDDANCKGALYTSKQCIMEFLLFSY